MKPLRYVLWFVVCIAVGGCGEPPYVTAINDDEGRGTRLVTLSPHLAELVYAVGAGDQLVGVSAYTDYPAAAASLPVVGDAFNLDQEQLTILEPDLLLAWDTGTPLHIVDELRKKGFRVEIITTTTLADVSVALRRIGRLTAREGHARKVAALFDDGLRSLASRAEGAAPISVFYQIDARPLYTVNGGHYVSGLVALCGGENIFADLGGLAPLVSVESVLERNPEVVMASSDAGPEAFAEWRRWPDLAATRYDNFFFMPADETGRATPRLLTAAKAFCSALEESRSNRERNPND